MNASPPSSVDDAVIALHAVTKRFGSRVALDGVSWALREGQTLGLVGESGSGKSTCVRLALALERPTTGALTFRGEEYPKRGRALKAIRQQVGFVLQDPYDSLDPKMTLREIVAEPIRTHRSVQARDIEQRVRALLDSVGLPEATLDSHPANYSGGGRQRIAIARALALDPSVLLCDEPTASLDVSVQAQILNLLLEARRHRNLSLLFVSHDLDLISRIADDVVVMRAGRVVESGPVAELIEAPRHPYTKALLASTPVDHPASRGTVRSSGYRSEGVVAP